MSRFNESITVFKEKIGHLNEVGLNKRYKIAAAITLNLIVGLDFIALHNHKEVRNITVAESPCQFIDCSFIKPHQTKDIEIAKPMVAIIKLKPKAEPTTSTTREKPKQTTTTDQPKFVIPTVSPTTILHQEVSARAVIEPSSGVDESYPQCPAPYTGKGVFGIVGITGGKNFTGNPCIAQEAANFSNLELYVNSDYTGINNAREYNGTPKLCNINNEPCLAYDYGYHAGVAAVNYAHNQGVDSETIWLDVETPNSWNYDSPDTNIQSIQGEIDALSGGFHPSTIGVYSTSYQWDRITGGWDNNMPVWYATAQSSQLAAKNYCAPHSFTGGPVKEVQFGGSNYDQDSSC